jgi:hypothetical protein
MEFEIPSEKLVRTYGRGEVFCSKLEGFYFRTLASWVGLLQSVRLPIGPLVSLICRSMFYNIKSVHY